MVSIDERFDFLGFAIRRRPKRETQKKMVYTVPSKKAVQAIKDKVSRRTYRSTRQQRLAEVLGGLNLMLRGWATYFRHGVSARVFHLVDDHAWRRLVGWIRAKHSGIGRRELRRRSCDRGWRIAQEGPCSPAPPASR